MKGKKFNNPLNSFINKYCDRQQTVGDVDLFNWKWGQKMYLIDFKHKFENWWNESQDKYYREMNGIQLRDGTNIESFIFKSLIYDENGPTFEKNILYSFTENKYASLNKDELISFLNFKIDFNLLNVIEKIKEADENDDFWN